MKILNTREQFTNLWESEMPFWIFKHSTRCSISDRSCRIVNETVDEMGLQDLYVLDVINQPELKIQIADFIGVTHESPQLILINKQDVIWHASHNMVSKDFIETMLRSVDIQNKH